MQYFKFEDEIHNYQKFVRNNINNIGNLLIICEQLFMKNNNRNFIDMLALDLDEKRIVILELKNASANHNIIGQAIKYYDGLLKSKENVKNLLKDVKSCHNLNLDDINYDPKVILIMPDFDNQILNSLSFVNINIEVIKFNLAQYENYSQVLVEKYTVVNDNCKVDLTSKVAKDWNFDEYIKDNINIKKIMLAKQFINYINNLFSYKNTNINVFFYSDKITIIIYKRIWCHIHIRRQAFNSSLEISIPFSGNTIDTFDLKYNGDIESYKVLSKSVNIKFCKLPIELLNKII